MATSERDRPPGYDPFAPPGQRIRYDDEDHGLTLSSIRSQKRMGIKSHLELRQFTDRANWENPGGIPARLPNGDPPYLENMPRAQARALVAMQDKISQSHLGRHLLRTARDGHVVFGFRTLPGDARMVAGYDSTQRQVIYSTDSNLASELDSKRFLGTGALTAAHELGHTAQDRNMGNDFAIQDVTVSHRDRLLMLRHMEAAATAASIQVAWDARMAGDDTIWQAALDPREDREEALAFEAAVKADPDAAQNGLARRAAHDAWFTSIPRLNGYDEDQNLDFRRMLQILAEQQAAGFPDPEARNVASQVGRICIGSSELAFASAMPDGITHMELPGLPGPRHEPYRALHNPRIAEQMVYLETLAERMREGQQLKAEDFEGYNRIADKYAGTEFAANPAPQDPSSELCLGEQRQQRAHNNPDLSEWRRNRERQQAPAQPVRIAPGKPG
jgi:hypothetical protein